jgi:hypothetical protein
VEAILGGSLGFNPDVLCSTTATITTANAASMAAEGTTSTRNAAKTGCGAIDAEIENHFYYAKMNATIQRLSHKNSGYPVQRMPPGKNS